MTLSGQCPACRTTLAFTEASLVAAPPDANAFSLDEAALPQGTPTLRCQCDATLIATDLSAVTEIPTECAECGSKYVVDRSGAGVELPCRCGAVVKVPTAILTKVSVGQSDSSASPEPSEIDADPRVDEAPKNTVSLPIVAFPDLYQLRVPAIDACDSMDAEADSIPESSDASAVELPIVAFPDLYQLRVPAIDASDTMDVEADSIPESSDASAVELPIVAFPDLYQLRVPVFDASDSMDAEADSIPESSDASAVELPIVAFPDLYQLRVPVFDASDSMDAEADSIPESSDASAVELPIVAFPDLYQLRVPVFDASDSMDAEADSIPESNDASAVELPIVAFPDLYQLRVPVFDASDSMDAEADSILESSDASAVELPIVAFPDLYQLPVSEASQGSVLPPPADASETHPSDETPQRQEPLEDSTAGAAVDLAVVSCPGCKREYSITRTDMGQTAECHCGFVFVMQENVDALDSAFCTDLMPFQPLAIDRTGTRVVPGNVSKENDTEERARGRKPQTAPARSVPLDSRDRRSRFAANFVMVAAGFLLMATAIGFVYRDRLGIRLLASNGITKPVKRGGPMPIPPADPTDSAPPQATGDRPQATGDRPLATGDRPQATGDRAAEDRSGGGVPDAVPQPVNVTERMRQPHSELSEFLRSVYLQARHLDADKTLGKEALFHFSETVNQLDATGVQFSVADLFWLAETWEGFGKRAATDDLESKCYWQAAGAFALAQTLETIDPQHRLIADRRKRELSEESRRVLRLASKPNDASTPASGSRGR
ncbi:hypothetical protein NZK35_27345 [Stieleria sp. ICT_E10.1]|uniref:hypothetical protein n=1 Tax=Stieleria sedimenti TaxID=2976331 RepID=UPI00217FB368|nr:hypothetical protein [Stieleria sedimenti]MCS7470382.1 hypothetical protein [Stieleria sedimenti]